MGLQRPTTFRAQIPNLATAITAWPKLILKINDKHNFSFHYFIGQGNQVAPVGTTVKDYYEVGPIHVSNYAASLNSALTPRLSNQLLAGVNYFRQVFTDFNTSFDL